MSFFSSHDRLIPVSWVPEYPGEPLEIEPWPKWDPTGTGNSIYVEPDVFMRFPDFDLIVEAKRWDDRQQNQEQWRRELIGYLNVYGEECRQVRIIALGGIWTSADDEVTDPVRPEPRCPVHMCKWERVLEQCQQMLKEIRRLKYPTSQNKANERILSDLIDLFGWHEFQTGVWFSELAHNLPQLSSWVQGHHKTFQEFYPSTC